MPRSSKAPELPPEPDINELIQNDVARIKRLLGLDVNRLALGSEVEGIVTNVFGSTDYTITGVNVIELVNVSTSLGPSQGGSGLPAQVVGLTVTPHAGSDTQLDLVWTAITAPDFNYYNVYRGLTTGFVVDSSSEIAQPVTNSYNNTGLSPGTTYYYRVSVTNDAELEGTPSSEVNRTTTGTASITPSLELHFDSSIADSSPNNHVPADITQNNGYLTPGQFGTAAAKINYPTTGDRFFYNDVSTLRMDPTVGFSISVWVYPVSFFSGARKTIARKIDDANNWWYLSVESTSLLMHFQVREAGTDYKRVTAAGLTVNAWNHIVGTFNSATNTIAIYKDAVAGTSSTAVTQFDTGNNYFAIGSDFDAINIAGTRFLGYLDELRYYKGTVLTSTQVTNLKNTNST